MFGKNVLILIFIKTSKKNNACITFTDFLFQITSALVTIWHYLRETRRSELGWYGVFHNNIVHDAALRHFIYRMLQMENEQRTRFYNVSLVFCFRSSITNVRI